MQFTKLLPVIDPEAMAGLPSLRHFFRGPDGQEEDAVRTQVEAPKRHFVHRPVPLRHAGGQRQPDFALGLAELLRYRRRSSFVRSTFGPVPPYDVSSRLGLTTAFAAKPRYLSRSS